MKADQLLRQNAAFSDIEKILKHSKKNKLTPEEIENLRQEKKELDAQFTDKKNEFLGTSQEQNTILRIVRKEFGDIIPNDVYDCVIQERVKYTTKRFEIEKGDCSVPNYRKGMPVPFRIKIGASHNILGIFRREDNPNQIFVKFP